MFINGRAGRAAALASAGSEARAWRWSASSAIGRAEGDMPFRVAGTGSRTGRMQESRVFRSSGEARGSLSTRAGGPLRAGCGGDRGAATCPCRVGARRNAMGILRREACPCRSSRLTRRAPCSIGRVGCPPPVGIGRSAEPAWARSRSASRTVAGWRYRSRSKRPPRIRASPRRRRACRVRGPRSVATEPPLPGRIHSTLTAAASRGNRRVTARRCRSPRSSLRSSRRFSVSSGSRVPIPLVILPVHWLLGPPAPTVPHRGRRRLLFAS